MEEIINQEHIHFATVWWQITDIKDELFSKKLFWTDLAMEEFLESLENQLKEEMINKGWEIIRAKIKERTENHVSI